jgi:hypothetical protein
MFSFFGKILKGRKPSQKSFFDKRVEAFGIDTSGPEFFDRHPTKSDIQNRLHASGLFRPDRLSWAAATIFAQSERSFEPQMKAIIGAGEPLSKEDKKELGIHPSRVVGRDFVNALQANDVDGAIDRLEIIVHTARAIAMNLHNLRRMEEIGITHVTFSTPKDERNTDIENRLEGHIFTISEARKLISDHEEDILRSTFIGEVKF